MTRFARAHGSKASNEKGPEEATSWSIMKQQMVEANNKIKQEKDEVQNKGITSIYFKKPANASSSSLIVPVWEVFDVEKKEQTASEKSNVGINNKNSKNLPSGSKKTALYQEKSSHKTSVSKKRSFEESVKVNNAFNNNENNLKNKRMKFSHNRQTFSDNKSCNNERSNFMYIGGREVEIADFQGFAVKKEDAIRLSKLRKDLTLKGVPRKEVEIALKAERRRAEKALAREKKQVCFKCRKFGHNMADCPECEDPSGLCFKCGSTEHSGRECRVVQKELFRFAHCFICQEQGHIARQCPDNPRGLYPKGGACKLCGDVTHLKKDCPKLINEKEKSSITVRTVQNNSIEVLDEEIKTHPKKEINVKRTSIVKF